jgi:DNA invertase Pin-like site-specific DNA recombinase
MPLRVTFYARVSSDSDNQLNSLENQVAYYPEFIQNNPNWTFVEGYIDEGLSGASVVKRENFQNMIADAEAGKFDLIITKKITRFARNTLDSIQYTRKLLSHGVGVFFQNDNINTFEEDSELRLTIMSGIAQDELRKHSSRVKFGHKQAVKKGIVLGCNNLFGYTWKDKRLYIDEGEARIVRELFERYAPGEYSTKSIAKLFEAKGYRSRSGTLIAPQVLSKILSNPRYKGYYVGGKTRSIDMFTKKFIYLPEEEWTMYKDESGEVTPAIVSEGLWDRANEVLSRRSEAVKLKTGTFNHDNLMTGKILCTHCNRTYYHRRKATGERWICSGKIDNGADSCPSVRLHEDEIVHVLLEVFAETFAAGDNLVEQYIQMYQTLEDTKSLAKEIAALNKKIELEEKKRDKQLEHNALGVLSDQEFAAMAKASRKIIEDTKEQLFVLAEQLSSKQEFERHIDLLRKTLTEARRNAQNGTLSRAFVEKYIDMIYATPVPGGVQFEIKLLTGKTTERFLADVKKRWGKGVRADKSGRLAGQNSNMVPVQEAMPLYLS